MLTKCDDCATEFEVESFEEVVTRDYEKTCFFCPACGREYIAFVKNESVKRQQRQVKKLYARMRKPGTSFKQQEKLMLGIKQAEKAVKEEMDALKQRLM